MQQILNSNQPVAWSFIPFSGLVLFLFSVYLDRELAGSWPGFLGVIASARLLHLLHLESGMRTRPGSTPSWIWTLIATPFVGLVSDAGWWCCCCLFLGLRLIMRLRDADPRPGTFLFIGMWWGLGVLLEATMWPMLAAFMIVVVIQKRPVAVELISMFIGLFSPIALAATVLWLIAQRLVPCWGWHPSAHPYSISQVSWLFLPIALGWTLREQSLVRATAQQRFSRRITNWLGAGGVLVVLGCFVWQWTTGVPLVYTRSVFPAVLAFVSTWSFAWLLPPSYKVSKAMPGLFVAMSVALVLLNWGVI